ncbi:MAG: hypothetical protein U9P10_02150 [Thermodesulfobacteriota bacterium]|nr:hypothetical protein [Thermodesulfobacteriota bacterium]
MQNHQTNSRLPRNQPEDTLRLVKHLLNKYNKKYHRRGKISPEAFEKLLSHDFPGNVRELINIIKKAVVMSEKKNLDQVIISSIENKSPFSSSLSDRETQLTLPEKLAIEEKKMLEKAVETCRTTRQIAAFLGISQPGVVRKLKKHSISIPKSKP